jgi:hypothetical protein
MPDMPNVPAPQPQPPSPTPSSAQTSSAANKKIGLWMIIGPFIGLVMVLATWAVMSFLLSSSFGGHATMAILNVLLGFVGLLCVVGIMVGIPLGIVTMYKPAPLEPTLADPRSGLGDASVIPPEIVGWNWGAFGLPKIWGIYHNVWICLLTLIPVVNIVVAIYMGVKGNELAWRKNKWTSVEDFKQKQAAWRVWGIVGFILSILFGLGQPYRSDRWHNQDSRSSAFEQGR